MKVGESCREKKEVEIDTEKREGWGGGGERDSERWRDR